MKKIVAIRSLRIAKQLIKKGHKVLSVEPCRKSKGFNVFIFEDCPEIQQVLLENARK